MQCNATIRQNDTRVVLVLVLSSSVSQRMKFVVVRSCRGVGNILKRTWATLIPTVDP